MVVSATMVTLLSDVTSVAMIAVLFSLCSSYTERPRCYFSLDVLFAFHRSFIQLLFSKILVIFRRVRKIAKSDH